MRFPKVEPGQEIVIDLAAKDLHFACCDCNLVHIMQFKVLENGNLSIRMWRHSRKTAALRRWRGVPVNKK
jgi:hypothetical protein